MAQINQPNEAEELFTEANIVNFITRIESDELSKNMLRALVPPLTTRIGNLGVRKIHQIEEQTDVDIHIACQTINKGEITKYKLDTVKRFLDSHQWMPIDIKDPIPGIIQYLNVVKHIIPVGTKLVMRADGELVYA